MELYPISVFHPTDSFNNFDRGNDLLSKKSFQRFFFDIDFRLIIGVKKVARWTLFVMRTQWLYPKFRFFIQAVNLSKDHTFSLGNNFRCTFKLIVGKKGQPVCITKVILEKVWRIRDGPVPNWNTAET